MATNTYESPLNSRYASKEMQYIFSPDKKFSTWRKLWIALAESEKELGLDITDKQIAQMKEHIYDINYDVAKAREKEVRHDVMSHVYAYGVQCPDAKPIIHLGATSCYVGDNTDIIIMTEAMQLVKKKLVCLIGELAKFAKEYKDLPTLAFTHFQPAQPTTVGKRASLWLEDLLMDLEDVDYQLSKAKLLGCKGTTGTQASFLELFEGDHEKCKMLDKKIAEKMGYEESFPVSGQTYPRKLDSQMLNTLSLIAQSAYKFSNDIRLLQHLKQIEEPFEKSQIGSSAMAYKTGAVSFAAPHRCARRSPRRHDSRTAGTPDLPAETARGIPPRLPTSPSPGISAERKRTADRKSMCRGWTHSVPVRLRLPGPRPSPFPGRPELSPLHAFAAPGKTSAPGFRCRRCGDNTPC